MDKQAFNEFKETFQQQIINPCTVCGGKSHYSIHGVKGNETFNTYYCKDDYFGVKNGKRKFGRGKRKGKR